MDDEMWVAHDQKWSWAFFFQKGGVTSLLSQILSKLQYNSPVILTFFFLSFFVLLSGYLTRGQSTAALFSVYRCSPTPLALVRLLTHVLGHSDFHHFAGNMTLLLVIGPPMEEKYGSESLLIMIGITAVVSGILQCVFFSNTALLGASGIVFMLILLSSISGVSQGMIPITLILVAFIYLGQEIVSMVSSHDNISHLTHIVGGLCGAAFGLFACGTTLYL